MARNHSPGRVTRYSEWEGIQCSNNLRENAYTESEPKFCIWGVYFLAFTTMKVTVNI